MVSGCMETVLVILDKPDGDIRVGHGDFLHQCRHMASFRLGSL